MRAQFAPATPHSDSIVRPSCSDCGTATFLVGIEPQRPGYELLTFQCPKCEHFKTVVGIAATGRNTRSKRVSAL
jgi:ribosomal protein S27E